MLTSIIAIQVSAVLVYIFCGLFSDSFVANFVSVVLLLMLDFWITKNISGRLLVGLRWWNEVTDEGSNWRFESLEEGQRTINKKDSICFWWLLYIMPFAWILLALLAFLRLNIAYLLIVVVAVVLSGANVVGYVKCSKQASKQLKEMATAAVTTGLTAAMSRV